MTLTFELDLEGAKANQNAKYLGQRSFSYCPNTLTHMTIAHSALA